MEDNLDPTGPHLVSQMTRLCMQWCLFAIPSNRLCKATEGRNVHSNWLSDRNVTISRLGDWAKYGNGVEDLDLRPRMN
jgi:hypothetical protein